MDVVCLITGYTPIMYACQTAQNEVIEYLSSSKIQAGLFAESVARDKHGDGRTAMDILVSSD